MRSLRTHHSSPSSHFEGCRLVRFPTICHRHPFSSYILLQFRTTCVFPFVRILNTSPSSTTLLPNGNPAGFFPCFVRSRSEGCHQELTRPMRRSSTFENAIVMKEWITPMGLCGSKIKCIRPSPRSTKSTSVGDYNFLYGGVSRKKKSHCP